MGAAGSPVRADFHAHKYPKFLSMFSYHLHGRYTLFDVARHLRWDKILCEWAKGKSLDVSTSTSAIRGQSSRCARRSRTRTTFSPIFINEVSFSVRCLASQWFLLRMEPGLSRAGARCGFQQGSSMNCEWKAWWRCRDTTSTPVCFSTCRIAVGWWPSLRLCVASWPKPWPCRLSTIARGAQQRL